MDVIRFFDDGFPLTIERLEFLQQTYTKAISQIANIVGDGNSIIHGAEISGSNITAGVVIINGEVMILEAGTYNARVGIFETVNEVPYNIDADNDGNLDLKVADVVRVARCAASGGVSSVQFDTFTRIPKISQIMPRIGDMKMIYSEDIPDGWSICDGTNGTPDMRNRFPIGVGSENALGVAGGEKEVSLTAAQNGEHTHGGTAAANGSHSHEYKDSIYCEEAALSLSVGVNGRQLLGSGGDNRNCSTDSNGSSVYKFYNNDDTEFEGTHSHSLSLNNSGNGSPHENRPPYRAVNFIMFTGF